MAETIILRSGEGRSYDLGKMTALFKADEGETGSRYCVSEWWMEPGTEGVGAHSHEANDEVFYVLEGAPGILIGEEWQQFGPGDFIRIPATVTHDFRNRTDRRAGLLNFFIPGGFESSMPAIVDWFDKNPD
ncbi:cupin domain-containing protein [Hoeflea sp. G2-23]|uniref:Cupin domain-containing protein n=1 Tax=Hoeflea algicola TaxID=2983763 RepID=A0ABT3Z4L7_9HYPH|nr:cupin domain-containing protein [Hoeflea algicola]MCY0146715.1 cupin domain-containing protein [Hoeflea algicola]